MTGGGIFGNEGNSDRVSRMLDAAHGHYGEVERHVLDNYIVDMEWRARFERSFMGVTLSPGVQAKLAQMYDLATAARALARTVWVLRREPGQICMVLRSAQAFAVWREEEEHGDPSEMPDWARRAYGSGHGTAPPFPFAWGTADELRTMRPKKRRTKKAGVKKVKVPHG